MGDLSAHFDSSEFACECCGAKITMSKLLIERLEKMHSLMKAKAIYINSGYRCVNNPWGFITDAHRKGIAADIKVQKQDGSFYLGKDIAEAAERIGFGGIGIIESDACHVDTRDSEPYDNNHWFGYEATGENFIETFQRGTVFPGEVQDKASKEMQIMVEIEGHKYSGLLEEI